MTRKRNDAEMIYLYQEEKDLQFIFHQSNELQDLK